VIKGDSRADHGTTSHGRENIQNIDSHIKNFFVNLMIIIPRGEESYIIKEMKKEIWL